MNNQNLSLDYYLTDCQGYKEFISSKGKVLPKRLKNLLRLAEIDEGKNILDIGCGRGELILHSALKSNIAVGIDISSYALQIASSTLRYWLRDYPFLDNKIFFLKTDARYLCFKEKVFDIVFLSDIIEHLDRESFFKVLLEVRRILKDSGKVIIHSSPNRIFVEYGLKIYWFLGKLSGIKLCWNMRKRLPLGCQKEIHQNEQTLFSLKRVFIRAGFKNIKLWLEKNPHYVYHFLKEDRFIKIINTIYRIIPFKHLFFADIYGVILK